MTIEVQELVSPGEIQVVEILLPGAPGTPGPAPELRVQGTILQYRIPPNGPWIDLFDFATLGAVTPPSGFSLNFSLAQNGMYLPLILED